jgi:hypothetical protein
MQCNAMKRDAMQRNAMHDMAWHGIVRHSMARHGTAWHDMSRHGMARLGQHSTEQSSAVHMALQTDLKALSATGVLQSRMPATSGMHERTSGFHQIRNIADESL